jgi:hypothetical protein
MAAPLLAIRLFIMKGHQRYVAYVLWLVLVCSQVLLALPVAALLLRASSDRLPGRITARLPQLVRLPRGFQWSPARAGVAPVQWLHDV